MLVESSQCDATTKVPEFKDGFKAEIVTLVDDDKGIMDFREPGLVHIEIII